MTSGAFDDRDFRTQGLDHHRTFAKALRMDELRDSIYYLQLARVARLKADATDDPDLARRLREAAVINERKARQLKQADLAHPSRRPPDGASSPDVESSAD